MSLLGLLVFVMCNMNMALVVERGSQTMTQPSTMRRAWVVEASSKPCPGQLGDLGVHDAAEAYSEQCTVDFERIQIQTVPMPDVEPGRALVNVKWSSVNPCNWKAFQSNTGHDFGLGGDFSGIVVKVGRSCRFAPGDAVWGMSDSTYQEYINVDCNPGAPVSKVPSGMSLQQGGVLGVTGTTAYGSLTWGANAPWDSSPTVLVLGGSGGTGHIGIQLAKAWGAGKVITTASANNTDFVKSVGADEVIDYHTADWWKVLKPGSIDIIYDCVCLHGTGDHAYDVLADGGAFVTIQSQSEASPSKIQSRPSIKHLHHNGLPANSHELDDLSDLVVKGKLSSKIDQVLPLDQVPKAFEKGMEGHTVGKLALQIS
mmetsp:Transcript_41356/g.90304  ORF Transcript_41356/g.90304 Transcript_41356/m.90304 type:complete len:370 (+) Transcript_41356:95-1204(+)